jgi:hypothetical protein
VIGDHVVLIRADLDSVAHALEQPEQVITVRFNHVPDLKNKLAALNVTMTEIKHLADQSVAHAQEVIDAADRMRAIEAVFADVAKSFRREDFRALTIEQKNALLDIPKMKALIADIKILSTRVEDMNEQAPALLHKCQYVTLQQADGKYKATAKNALLQPHLPGEETTLSQMAKFAKDNQLSRRHYDTFVTELQTAINEYQALVPKRCYSAADQRSYSIDTLQGKIEELKANKAMQPEESFDKLLEVLEKQITQTQESHSLGFFSRFTSSALVNAYQKVLATLPAQALQESRNRQLAAIANARVLDLG